MTEQAGLGFGVLLRQLRDDAGLTQDELAESARVSQRAISDLERGINRTARKDTALLLAGALGMDGAARELFVAAARGRAPAEALLAARPWNAVIDSPYRGLKAFQEQDAAFFFGREAATAVLLERMSRLVGATGLLVVSGVSGAGKTSLLRAGVLPQIRKSGLAGAPQAATWPCLVFTPTGTPLDELALRVALLAGADAVTVRRGLDADPAGFVLTARQAVLMRPQRPAGDLKGRAEPEQPPQPRDQVVLVVDQFEQLFTQCTEEGQRRAFITALHAAATTRHGPDQTLAALVVLGVRADFEARCASYPQLADPVQDRYLVTAMTERQLRMAITEPAKKVGAKVDDDLTDLLLAEVRTGQPGAVGAGVLPLLSHALDQAWRCRTGQAVTLADYERAGGIDGAVAASAQRAYDTLTAVQQAAARQVFLRLTATGSDGVHTADRATQAELTDGQGAAEAADVAAVLEVFAAERLLTLSADTVEISHEVLLSAWPLLRDTWLAEPHADRIVRSRLHTTAAEWARHSRDPSYLYSGTLLQAATDTAARISADPAHHPPLSQTERDFLDASDRANQGRARQRQVLVALLTVLVLGLAAATVVAVRASQQVTRQFYVVTSGLLASQSRVIGDTNPALSKLLSVAAWRINPSSTARSAMLAAAARPGIAILKVHGIGAVLGVHTGSVNSVAFSPDGKILAGGSVNRTAQLWDVASRRQIGYVATYTGSVTSVAFSPNGKFLATGSDDAAFRLWDVATHQMIGPPILGDNGPVTSVAFSPDGKTLATSSDDGTVRLWSVATRRQRGRPITVPGGPVHSVAFSPHGTTLVTVGADGEARLWNVATHRQSGRPFVGEGGGVTAAAFSRRGEVLATGNFDNTVWLWDIATHQPIGTPLINSFTGSVISVAFSPTGTTLATGSTDGTVQLWDETTHQPAGPPLTGHTGPVTSVAFSANGTTLATGSTDGTVRLWNVARPPHNLAQTTNLVRYLCAIAGPSLTRAEWARYVPTLAYLRVCP